MLEERKYKFNGTIPQWLPGVGVVKPGQTFVSRFPLEGNPLIVASSEDVSKGKELTSDDKVCKKCVRVKKVKNKKKV